MPLNNLQNDLEILAGLGVQAGLRPGEVFFAQQAPAAPRRKERDNRDMFWWDQGAIVGNEPPVQLNDAPEVPNPPELPIAHDDMNEVPEAIPDIEDLVIRIKKIKEELGDNAPAEFPAIVFYLEDYLNSWNRGYHIGAEDADIHHVDALQHQYDEGWNEALKWMVQVEKNNKEDN